MKNTGYTTVWNCSQLDVQGKKGKKYMNALILRLLYRDNRTPGRGVLGVWSWSQSMDLQKCKGFGEMRERFTHVCAEAV